MADPGAMQTPNARGALGMTTTSLLLAAYLLLATNASFWRALWRALGPGTLADLPLLAGVGAMLLALLWMLLSLAGWRRVAKPAWVVLIVLAASAAYFMDSYGVVVDRVAIQSVFESDPREVSEWISLRMLPYVVVALLPTLWLWRLRLQVQPWTRELGLKIGVVAIAVAVIGAGVFLDFARLSSLARNHRELQHMINPTTVLASLYGYTRRVIAPRPTQIETVDADARRGPSWRTATPPRLLVLVVGESARASSFSLLGYPRATNPRLAVEDTINFGNVTSCGTSTAVSLPCMFSDLGQSAYSDDKARGRESLLDVLQHAGLHSIWLDNNTGSKHIAERTGERSVAAADDRRWCSGIGCFDDILVDRLRRQLDKDPPPAVVVLHQKGSHGPSYFERYPADFRRFEPTCDSNELEDCTREQIINTYDNSILYTDHNLAEIIELLRSRAGSVDSAMIYLSDHGESTGENGMYLHGAPHFMAPDEQTRVPLLLWLSNGFESRYGIDRGCLQSGTGTPLSHDHLFHSVLGLMDVVTRGYRAELDLFASCRTPVHSDRRAMSGPE